MSPLAGRGFLGTSDILSTDCRQYQPAPEGEFIAQCQEPESQEGESLKGK